MRTRQNHTRAAIRRGTAYAFFLMTAMLIAIIGMTGLSLAGLGLRSVIAVNERVAARACARSGIDLALVALYRTGNWRDNILVDTWSSPVSIGDGTAAWKVAPLVGTSFTGKRNGRVRVYGRGTCGDATWLYSAEVQPPLEEPLTSEIINGNIESGTVAPWFVTGGNIEASPTKYHTGAYGLNMWSRSPGYAAVQTLDSVINGGRYDLRCWLRVAQGTGSVSGMSTAWLEVTTTEGVQQFEFFDINVTTSWTEGRGTVTPTWTGSFVSARLMIDNDEGHWFYLDDVVLFGTPGPPGPVEGTWTREAN